MKAMLTRALNRLHDAISPERRMARYDFPDAHRLERRGRGQDDGINGHFIPGTGRNQGGMG
jgi:hypothetical protein